MLEGGIVGLIPADQWTIEEKGFEEIMEFSAERIGQYPAL
jgi:hypothetical protein